MPTRLDHCVQTVRRLLSDTRGLLLLHLALLICTLLVAGFDSGHLRLQSLFLLFVLPGWCLAARMPADLGQLETRYFHAVLISLFLHGWLVAVGAYWELGLRGYYLGFLLVLTAAVADRLWCLRTSAAPRLNGVSPSRLLLGVALLLLIVVIYRAPRSNDIGQFLLQQQDAVVRGQLAPSAIGMAGMGIDEPMPRWRANYWHLWPSLMSVASGISVNDVLYRYAPIPLALAMLIGLIVVLRELGGPGLPLWAIALALWGPVVLWWRTYNAFTYSFRLTNSPVLDKDFCLFFLIPSVAYLAAGYLRGRPRCGWLLLAAIPAAMRFHPLTPVYLVLLVPWIVVGYARGSLFAIRPATIAVGALGLLCGVIVLGDAQSFHQQIQQIVRLDFEHSITGAPLHYWIGFYGVIEALPLELDTSVWRGGRLYLRTAIIQDSGLFLAAHLGWLMWGFEAAARGRWRAWIASGVALAMVWAMIGVSPWFLSRFPHWLAGYERLHWFAFLPALLAVARGATALVRGVAGIAKRRGQRDWQRPLETAATLAMAALCIYSAAMFWIQQPTVWQQLRGLNSLLDYELATAGFRPDRSAAQAVGFAAKPAYLGPGDRVLLLDGGGSDDYWLRRQNWFWSDPYAEAFALHRRGEAFLRDRRWYYALRDRTALRGNESLSAWLEQRGITLVIDRRDGGDEYLRRLNGQLRLGWERVQEGIWRVPLPLDRDPRMVRE